MSGAFIVLFRIEGFQLRRRRIKKEAKSAHLLKSNISMHSFSTILKFFVYTLRISELDHLC